MNWLESQIDVRAKYDAQMSERAWAELASSVSGADTSPHFLSSDLEQVDGAVVACLRYNGVEPGVAPDEVTDPNERLEWLCRPSGTMHRKVSLTKGWYKHAFGPLVSRLDTGEAIALLPRGVHGYYYLDPKTAEKVHVNTQTAEHIAETAVFFYLPLPTHSLKTLDLARFLTHVFNRHDYLLILAASLAVTLIGLLPAWAYNIAFSTVVPSGQVSLVAPIAALLIGVVVSSSLIGICRSLIMSRISIKLDVCVEAATFARVLSLPTSFFREYSSGNLATRVSQIKMLAQTLTSVALGAQLSVALSFVYMLQIFAYARPLALPALIVVVTQAALTVFVTRITIRYERATTKATAELSGTETALLNGIQKLKLAGAEDRAFAKWAHGYAAYARAAFRRPALILALPALVAFIGLLGNIFIYYLAGRNTISLADYMSFNVAYGQASAAIMGLSAVAGQLATIRPMIEMVTPIFEAEPEVDRGRPNVASLNGAIEMSGVSFRYDERSPYVVQNLSFKIRPGEYVALVGRSGCGKSTILRLLLGFEQAERGTITYGPYDVTKVDLRSLRRHIGVVMQDGKLFLGDIGSNITISAPSATLDDAWEAAELAGIAEDIRKMPMGMQTLVSEGSGGISGGQRQRIMIARAVCGHRKILMLDEATSALDNKTQRHVSESLETLNCTRLVVAHRLSTVRHCDRILVVDGGQIIEEGTYEELLAKKGFFAELVARQQLEDEI